MSEKIKCSVCSFCLEDNKGLSKTAMTITIWDYHPEYKRIIELYGNATFHICFCCYLKALGVRPKEKSFTDKVCAEMAAKIISNHCDTLTRQHTAVIENAAGNGDSILKHAGYTPTLIPGCPAEEKNNPVSPKEIIETLEWMIKYFRWQHTQLGTEGDYSPELRNSITILEQLKKENK
jgi:hypothetical protein